MRLVERMRRAECLWRSVNDSRNPVYALEETGRKRRRLEDLPAAKRSASRGPAGLPCMLPLSAARQR